MTFFRSPLLYTHIIKQNIEMRA